MVNQFIEMITSIKRNCFIQSPKGLKLERKIMHIQFIWQNKAVSNNVYMLHKIFLACINLSQNNFTLQRRKIIMEEKGNYYDPGKLKPPILLADSDKGLPLQKTLVNCCLKIFIFH